MMSDSAVAAPGRLIYIVGPSGAGKNSVIAAAKERSENINKNKDLYFASRYVTRTEGSDADDLAISSTAFRHYQLAGLFALDWQAHGNFYGIGTVINTPLLAGKTVVVNGSRAYAAQALLKYPAMIVVEISVAPEVARARLTARGRESRDAIEARVMRAPLVTAPANQIVTIDNSGPLTDAAEALAQVLLGSDAQVAARVDGCRVAMR